MADIEKELIAALKHVTFYDGASAETVGTAFVEYLRDNNLTLVELARDRTNFYVNGFYSKTTLEYQTSQFSAAVKKFVEENRAAQNNGQGWYGIFVVELWAVLEGKASEGNALDTAKWFGNEFIRHLAEITGKKTPEEAVKGFIGWNANLKNEQIAVFLKKNPCRLPKMAAYLFATLERLELKMAQHVGEKRTNGELLTLEKKFIIALQRRKGDELGAIIGKQFVEHLVKSTNESSFEEAVEQNDFGSGFWEVCAEQSRMINQFLPEDKYLQKDVEDIVAALDEAKNGKQETQNAPQVAREMNSPPVVVEAKPAASGVKNGIQLTENEKSFVEFMNKRYIGADPMKIIEYLRGKNVVLGETDKLKAWQVAVGKYGLDAGTYVNAWYKEIGEKKEAKPEAAPLSNWEAAFVSRTYGQTKDAKLANKFIECLRKDGTPELEIAKLDKEGIEKLVATVMFGGKRPEKDISDPTKPKYDCGPANAIKNPEFIKFSQLVLAAEYANKVVTKNLFTETKPLNIPSEYRRAISDKMTGMTTQQPLRKK